MKVIIKKILRFLFKICNNAIPAKIKHFFREQAEYIKLEGRYGKLDGSSGSKNKTIKIEIGSVSGNWKFPDENEMITRIVDSFCFAKQQQKDVHKSYLPGEEWAKILRDGWKEYHNAIFKKDIGSLKLLLRNFFRNEGINGFWGTGNMFLNFCNANDYGALKRADKMMEHYKVWRKLCPTTPLTELEAPKIGNPWGYNIEGVLLYEPVFEYYYQAQYFNNLLNSIENPIILEIGGGFGGLAYFLRKLNPSIKYIGLDLPENILIQSYYLSFAFPDSKILTFDKDFKKLDIEKISSYDIILLPNLTLPLIDSELAGLIINIRSLSEMSPETIATYLKEIDRIGNLFFFHENIFQPRLDNLYGTPSSLFPPMNSFFTLFSSMSRWPKYQSDSGYPCQENLLIKKEKLLRSFNNK